MKKIIDLMHVRSIFFAEIAEKIREIVKILKFFRQIREINPEKQKKRGFSALDVFLRRIRRGWIPASELS